MKISPSALSTVNGNFHTNGVAFHRRDFLPVLILYFKTADSGAALTEDVYLYGSTSGVTCVPAFSTDLFTDLW
jgi:hypothetical protein